MVNTNSPKVTKEDKIIGSSSPPFGATKHIPVIHIRSTKKSMSSLSKCKKFTIIDVSTDEEFKNNNTINDCDTNEQAYIVVENTNNFSDDDVGIDTQHSESVSDEEIDEEDDLEDFINDDDADDEDDDTDDEYTDDDF
ncbi:hypothetical protein Tco_0397856 [Tanacetum coccineum]